MDLKVIHIVALSILALTGYTQAGCITKQYVNGCSIPFRFQFYYKREFTPSCNKHDVCYSCVSTTMHFIGEDGSSILNRVFCT